MGFSMNQNLSWSLSLGKWVGVPVRIHAFLVLFVVLIFGIDFNSIGPTSALLSTALVTSGVLVLSLVVHELAHVFALHNVGGQINSVTLMPWGGNSDFEYPAQRSLRLISILAGPFVNFAICLFGAALLIHSSDENLISIIHPFRPHHFLTADPATSLVQIVTWINFQLMLTNLLPCFPFDGAQILRTIFQSLNPSLPQYRIESAIRVSGTAVALTMMGFAWLMKDIQVGPVQPTWAVWLVGGIALYFAARHSFFVHTEQDIAPWEEAKATALASESMTDSGSFYMFGESEDPEYSKWLVEKQEERIRDELHTEQQEIEMADEILEKLHRDGIEAISNEERRLLQRVSERLRRKRKMDVIE